MNISFHIFHVSIGINWESGSNSFHTPFWTVFVPQVCPGFMEVEAKNPKGKQQCLQQFLTFAVKIMQDRPRHTRILGQSRTYWTLHTGASTCQYPANTLRFFEVLVWGRYKRAATKCNYCVWAQVGCLPCRITAGISTLRSLQRKLSLSYFSSTGLAVFQKCFRVDLVWTLSSYSHLKHLLKHFKTTRPWQWRNCDMTWSPSETLPESSTVFHCCNFLLRSAQGPKPSTRKRWHGGQLPLDDADPAESHQGLRLQHRLQHQCTHMESYYEYLWIILHDCTVLLFAKCEVSSVEHVEHVVSFFQALACAWKIHRQCALCCVPSFWCVDPFIAVRTFAPDSCILIVFSCIFRYCSLFIWASCSFLRSLPQHVAVCLSLFVPVCP